MGLIDDMFEEVLGCDANVFRNKLFVTDVLCLQMPYNLDMKALMKYAYKLVPGFTERLAQATMNVISWAADYSPSSSDLSSSTTSSSSSSSSHLPSSSTSDTPPQFTPASTSF